MLLMLMRLQDIQHSISKWPLTVESITRAGMRTPRLSLHPGYLRQENYPTSILATNGSYIISKKILPNTMTWLQSIRIRLRKCRLYFSQKLQNIMYYPWIILPSPVYSHQDPVRSPEKPNSLTPVRM